MPGAPRLPAHGNTTPLAQEGRAQEGLPRACAWTAKEQGAQRIEAERLHVSLVFYPPSRRAFDLDNMLARMKSGLDGLADVLGVDDKHWSLSIARAETIGGMVRVEVAHG